VDYNDHMETEVHREVLNGQGPFLLCRTAGGAQGRTPAPTLESLTTGHP
jgi:hypothetical protein